MDGKSEQWRKGADELLVALARQNKYIVSDMVIIFLESAGYGLTDYSPLGGVFKRAAKAGIIKRIERPTKQALWVSNIYPPEKLVMHIGDLDRDTTHLIEGETLTFRNFGSDVDGITFQIAEVSGNTLHLERKDGR